MIDRKRNLQEIHTKLANNPIVALIGARQVGKTTLARTIADAWDGPVEYFDLEDPGQARRLSEPMLMLRELSGLVVIDEIQRAPDLFPVLRVLADRPDSDCRFLILGSASPDLLRQSSESLAGRISYFELKGFSLDEVGVDRLPTLWVRGGLPRSFLAASDRASGAWRRDFIRAFLERDIREFGFTIAPETLRRFWTMLAHYHGQTMNYSEFGRSFGVADTTIRHYLDVLISMLVVRRLNPFHENISKRQVKSPKVYLADSGLLHTLLNLESRAEIESHPKLGASWEGFCLEAVVRHIDARWDECFFWATHTGAELDLLVVRGMRRRGFEFKRTDAPGVSPSMRSAMKDLRLDDLTVIHAGTRSFPLGKTIRAIPASRILEELEPQD